MMIVYTVGFIETSNMSYSHRYENKYDGKYLSFLL